MGDDGVRFSKWAGWNGLIASIAFIGTVVVANVWKNVIEQPSGPSDITRFLGEVSDNSAAFIVYGVCGIVLSVLYIPMSFGVHRRLNRSSRSWFGTAMMVIGLGILLAAYVITLLQPASLAPLAEELGEAGAETIYVINDVATVASLVVVTVGSVLTLAIGPYFWGREVLNTGAFSRWLGWTGVFVGVSGLVWFVWYLEIVPLLPVLIANVLASLVFYTGLSLALLRGEATSTSA